MSANVHRKQVEDSRESGITLVARSQANAEAAKAHAIMAQASAIAYVGDAIFELSKVIAKAAFEHTRRKP